MTAARYKLPAGYAKMAGQKFGLNLYDLFGNDEDDTSGEGFLPQFSTRAVEKGRGGVLGYKAPKLPTRESVFQITPSAGATLDLEAPAETEKVEEKPERENLGSLASKWGQSALFGAQDYFKALEAGYTPEEVRSYMEQNPTMVHETNRPGQTAGLYEQIARGQVNQPSEYFTPQQFLDRQISNTQSSSGSSSSSQSSTPSSSQSSTPSFDISYGSAYSDSDKWLGGADVEAAKAQGASNEEIASWIQSNQDKLRYGNLPGGGGLYDQYKQYMK